MIRWHDAFKNQVANRGCDNWYTLASHGSTDISIDQYQEGAIVFRGRGKEVRARS